MKIEITPANVFDVVIAQKIFEASPEYFIRTEGKPPDKKSAGREMVDCPPKEKRHAKYRKVFCLVKIDGEHKGVVDFHQHHPKEGIAYLGLLLLTTDMQKKGLGLEVYRAAEEFAREKLGAKTIRLGVSKANDVEGFWRKCGFNQNGHTYKWTSGERTNNVTEMEKSFT